MNTKSIPDNINKILLHFNLNESKFLGEGAEGLIFAFNKDEIIKIYKNPVMFLQNLMEFQELLSKQNFSFKTPRIREFGEKYRINYTIEDRLFGTPMHIKFPQVSSENKYIMLKNYYDALRQLHAVHLNELAYGNILQTEMAVTDKSWQGFLFKILSQRVSLYKERLEKDVIGLDQKIGIFKNIIQTELEINEKCLVHGDYYVNQVLVNDVNQISAVLDINMHAVVGDSRLDIASISFFENSEYTPEYILFLKDLTIKDYGKNILPYIDFYKIYYAFYFFGAYKDNPKFYQSLLQTLNDEILWEKIA